MNNNTEIESLLFKQVEKPDNYLTTKVVNLWDNRYRINVYTEKTSNNLMIERKIQDSYFCRYEPGSLTILNL